MTLPDASSLTDEQLRVLAAEARGWKRTRRALYAGSQNVLGWEKNSHLPMGSRGRIFTTWLGSLPPVLHDANAALRLLEPFFAWKAGRLTGGGTYVEIIDTEERCIKMTPTDMINRWPFWAEAPDFCRAIVLAFLRAEGKIL